MKHKNNTEGARLLQQKVAAVHKASNGSLGKPAIAEKLGVTVSTLDHWLAGRRRPTLEQAVTLRRLLKIKVDDWTKEARA